MTVWPVSRRNAVSMEPVMARESVAFTKIQPSVSVLLALLVMRLGIDFAMVPGCAQSPSRMWHVSPMHAMAALRSVDRFARKMQIALLEFLIPADGSSDATMRVVSVLTSLFLVRFAPPISSVLAAIV